MKRKILAIESSCDETACAIVEEDFTILSSVVTSQIDIHTRFGGVVPEVASRMHIEQISVVIKETLQKACLSMEDIDAVAYTAGPGLIGSLHVGAIAAKTLAFFYKKPLIAVHHLKGHIFINELLEPLQYPLLALIVSGGHTELVYMKDDSDFKILGMTLDDAIGEAYDKVARLLEFPYPGGPKIDAAAKLGKAHYILPKTKVAGYDFSFSGIKNAAIQLVKKAEKNKEDICIEDLAFDFQEAALRQLLDKTKQAIDNYPVKQFLIGGGVAANSRLRELVEKEISLPTILPPLKYCTDNATMIACAAIHQLQKRDFASFETVSDPSLSIEDMFKGEKNENRKDS